MIAAARRMLSPYPDVDASYDWERRSLWPGPLDRYDKFALGFIAVVALVLLCNVADLVPSMSDTWYHLALAKQVRLRGHIPGWADWEYAPVGRPNLYPPLLHLLLAGLSVFVGGVVNAGHLCAALFLPVAFLTCWYGARWLLNSRLALLAVLLLSLDFGHVIVMTAYIAACLINILLPLLVVAFLARRAWLAIVVLTLMYYAHLGLPHLVSLGLLLFGLKYRSYWRLSLKVVGISFIWYLPWLTHVLKHLEWVAGVGQNLGLPGGLLFKVLALQIVSPVLICGLFGLRKLDKTNVGHMLPKYVLIGMLPLLVSYGGRYAMHTAPIWAWSGALVLERLLPATAGRLRPVGLLLCTFLPFPSVGFFGGIAPLPFNTSLWLVFTAVQDKPMFGGEEEKSEAYREDCNQVVQWLEEHTTPGEVVHTNKEWVADMIALLSDRRVDFGAWWECSKEDAKRINRAYRDNRSRAVFVWIEPEADVGSILGPTQQMVGVDEIIKKGRLLIGWRKQRRFSPLETRTEDFERGLEGWEALTMAGATGSIEHLTDQWPLTPLDAFARLKSGREVAFGRRAWRGSGALSWTFAAPEHKLAAIRKPMSPTTAEALELRIWGNRPMDDMVIGFRERGGADYHWPLTVANAKAWQRVRIVFDWLTPGEGLPGEHKFRADRMAEMYIARPAQANPSGQIEIRLDEVRLMDCEIVPREGSGAEEASAP